jgi:alanyl-tRNA synthetase
MKTSAARSAFLRYFEGQKHTIVPSDSLIPSTDPSLLFTSAGMVQFKPNFQNPLASPYPRAATAQKCLRTSDIERVGHTLRHLTFFEMLGNFSFGDYFKTEAIHWGWEFLTKTMGLPGDRFIISVYKEDDEAFNLWKKIVPESRIVRLGEDSNFWTMGPTGPCGPCSEILWDRGDAWGKAGDYDADRYLEVWNLVFTQFDRSADGTLTPLPRKNIDTGMGLERLSVVLQGVDSAFDTDGFQTIFGALAKLAKRGMPAPMEPSALPSPELIAFRRISDHARAISFMISDGILPSNEGRGYVLRRLLRQAQRAGKTIGIQEPFLNKLTGTIIQVMGDAYPDLLTRQETIASVIKLEEEKFLETLDAGTRRLEELVSSAKSKSVRVLGGDQVFQLYDTFGFPIELTREMAESSGLEVDEAGFKKAREQAVYIARQAWKGSGAQDVERFRTWKTKVSQAIQFRGYDSLDGAAVIQKPMYKKTANGWVETDTLHADEEGEAVILETPFYPEGGGQVGDVGQWKTESGLADVLDTQAPVDGLTVHSLKVFQGSVSTGQLAQVAVDRIKRDATMRHHTATHLLHKALRQLLGNHVTQAGSLVAPDRLRFDFTHFSALTPEQRRQVEDVVNEKILADIPVQAHEVDRSEARTAGAMALFGEKYGARVRTIRVHPEAWEKANESWSLELCGGTHVRATGQIGLFKILSENGLSAGVRRIEAVTGMASLGAVRRMEEQMAKVSDSLRTTPDALPQAIEKLVSQRKDLERQIEAQKTESLKRQFGQAGENPAAQVQTLDGLRFIARQLEGVDDRQLRDASDTLRDQQKLDIVVVAAVNEGKISFVVAAKKDAAARGVQAGALAKVIAARLQGSGGGKPEFAQGGGRDVAALPAVLSDVGNFIQSLLNK